MTDNILRKLIVVEANTEGLRKLNSDLPKAQALLNKMGVEGETVSKVATKLSSTMDATGKMTTKTMYNMETASGKTFKGIIADGGAATKKMGDFEMALRRAAIVAPVWMALRAVMQLVFSTIQEGVKNWVDFDAALMKSKAVVHGFTGDSSIAIGILKERIIAFSKESGIAVEKLASAFYRFGTVGIKFEDAMEGAFASARLAKATFGDTDTVARALAMAYNLLGHTIDSSLSPAEKMNQIAGVTYKLWQSNAFEINEFASALQGFVGTANILNFTLFESEALLASLGTAGVIGAKGGTLLKTAMFQLAQNLDKLAPKMGIAITAGESMHDIFLRVVDALAQVGTTGQSSAGTLEVISEIFGGVKGGQVTAALVAVNEEWKKNRDITKEVTVAVKDLQEQYKGVIDSLSGSAERIANYKKLIGEAFVKGIAGGDSFEESLRNIANTMDTAVIPAAQEFAKILNFLRLGVSVPITYLTTWKRSDFIKKITEEEINNLVYAQKKIDTLTQGIRTIGLKLKLEKLSSKEIDDMRKNLYSIKRVLAMEISDIEIKYGDIGLVNKEQIEANLKSIGDLLNKKQAIVDIDEEEVKKQIEIAEANSQTLIERQKIYELQKDLSGYKEELKYIQMSTDGVDKLGIAQEKARDQVKLLVAEYNKMDFPDFMPKPKPMELEKTMELLKKAISGEIGAEEIKIYFTGLPDIKNLEQFKSTMKAIGELIKTEIENNAILIKAEKEKLNIASQLNIQKNLGNLSALQLIELEKQLVEQSNEAYQGKEKSLKLYELELKYLEEISKLTGKYANEFKNTFQESLKDALQTGEVDTALAGLQKKLEDMYFESISKKLTNQLGKTGIFEGIGGIFAGIEDPIALAHVEGIQKGVQYIVQAHMSGMQKSMAMSTPGGTFTGGGVGTGGAGYQLIRGAGGIMQTVPTMQGGYGGGQYYANTGTMGANTMIAPPNYYAKGGAGSGFVGGMASGGAGLPSWMPFNKKLGQPMAGEGSASWGTGLMGGLMAGYAGYQSAGGGSQGALKGGLAGIGSVMMMIPGLQVLGAAMVVASMFVKNKKQTSTQSTQSTEQAAMAPLLVQTGGAPLPEKYALPESRYWAGRQGRRQGGNFNVTINVEGTMEETVNKISSKISDIYNRELNRGLNTIFPN